jgi:integrase
LIELFHTHQAKQNAERNAARQLWHGEDWVFGEPDGRSLNPNTDYREWKELLKEAGLRDARLTVPSTT